jgi:hypothetical protein
MRNDVSEPLDRACAGRVLPERNMRPHLVIIDGIFRKDSAKVIRVLELSRVKSVSLCKPPLWFLRDRCHTLAAL